jgi:uncharacterized membrane protein
VSQPPTLIYSKKNLWTRLLCGFMVAMGLLHLVAPRVFARAVPDYLPWHFGLVIVSGLFEVVLGIGLLIPGLQNLSARGLILLFIAVFPANVNMALHPDHFVQHSFTPILWARLPFQPLLIFWAWKARGSKE